MPHKRAKQSVRLAEREKKGFDLAPTKGDSLNSKEFGGMSKSMYRVFNAEAIRTGRKQKTAKKAKEGPPAKKSKLSLNENETLRSFNQRVEEAYRPEVSAAFKTSRQAEGRANKKRKRVVEQGEEERDVPQPTAKPTRDGKKRAEEFARAPTRSRLNDVAMEPPSLGKPARQSEQAVGSHRLPLTPSQRAAIEEERQRAIEKYREIRDARQPARMASNSLA